ncbi:MAG: helix-hairpin-helix domain-containing protein [Solobacterium sp.]|nr:helix-hairpin-helix domain-containing protein [Solobacterium sp.]
MKRLLIFFMVFAFLLMTNTSIKKEEDFTNDEITVLFEGEIEEKGELTLTKNTQLKEAIEIVGLTEEADTSVLNLNQTLKDQDEIIIPKKKENRISINHSTKEQLQSLIGIGEKTAEAIIAYREKNGYFQSLEELLNVKGIGEKKYAKIKDWICL